MNRINLDINGPIHINFLFNGLKWKIFYKILCLVLSFLYKKFKASVKNWKVGICIKKVQIYIWCARLFFLKRFKKIYNIKNVCGFKKKLQIGLVLKWMRVGHKWIRLSLSWLMCFFLQIETGVGVSVIEQTCLKKIFFPSNLISGISFVINYFLHWNFDKKSGFAVFFHEFFIPKNIWGVWKINIYSI